MSSRKKSRTKHAGLAERPLIAAPPEGSVRRRTEWFILLFLIVHLLIPLRWYVGRSVGAEVDERFCWRMFSAVSMQRCQISLWETVESEGQLRERPLPFPTIVSPAWNEHLIKYHQPAVVEKLLREHCRKTSARKVLYHRVGTWSDGSPVEVYQRTVQCRE